MSKNINSNLRRILVLSLVFCILFSSIGMFNNVSHAYGYEKTYTIGDFNRLSYEDMIKVLEEIDYTQISDLFQYSGEAQRFYSDTYRMDSIRRAIEDKGRIYSPNDNQGIPTLVEVLRAGYYLGFYNDGLSYLRSRSEKDKCIPAILSIQNNPNFRLGEEAQNQVINSAALIVNNASSNVEVLNNFTPILKDYVNNLDRHLGNKTKGDAIFNIIRGAQYDLSNYTIYENRNKPEDSPWFGRIDGFIEATGDLALIRDMDPNEMWLLNNGVYCIGTLGKYHNKNTIGQEILTRTMENYPKYSEPYLRAAKELGNNYKGLNIYGEDIQIDKLIREAEDVYYPNTYTFDDGTFIIRAGDKVKEEKILRLYWASREVRSQYFRSIGTDQALEEGNADDVLTMIIYNSPDEYALNSVINNLDTENGGMYIERDGTFYTYERTKEDSIYTLEELFRHEYVHYLQGRYVVPGMWGEGKMYRNDRLVWYEEGGAEYFAGATRTEGVKPRKSVASKVHYTDKQYRYDVRKILSSTYSSGFDFYNYAYFLQDYLNQENPYVYNRITEYIMNDDVDGYDRYISQLKGDYSIDRGYWDNMDKILGDFDNLGIPLVEDDYLLEHDVKSPEDIKNEISSVARLTNAKVEKQESQFFNTFTVTGTYTGEYYQGKLGDFERMNSVLDKTLKDLSNLEWSGYNTVNAYFTNYRTDSNNNYVFDLVFHGILPGGDFPEFEKSLEVDINGVFGSYENEELKFEADIIKSPNGDIVEYIWELDNKYIGSDKNISIKFDKPGIYNLKLKVRDILGYEESITRKVTIFELPESPEPGEPEEPEEPEIPVDPENPGNSEWVWETESNDDFETSNKVNIGQKVLGVTDVNDKDIFTFEVTETGYMELELKELEGRGVNFIVYMDGNFSLPYGYPTEITNGSLKNNGYYYPGKYHVLVYGVSGEKVTYNLNIGDVER